MQKGMTMRRILAGLAAWALVACNPVENMNAGEDRIADFQDAYSRGDDEAMWAMTGPEWRNASTRAEFDELLRILEARMGSIEGTERVGFNVNTNTEGTFTVVQMQTQFEKADGTEVYTFLGNGSDMQLVGWNVNSDALLVTADEVSQLDGNDARLDAEDQVPVENVVEAETPK